MQDIFESPIKSKKVRNDVYAYMYRNGTININGQKFIGFSLTGAIYQYRQGFPKYQK